MIYQTQDDGFVVNLESFEGPLDLLLNLARSHEVDLREISMVALADQYMNFLQKQPVDNLVRAADYLVMAAWLTWLKARLIAPDAIPEEEEENPLEEESLLREKLIHLKLIRESVDWLKDRPQLGRDFFARHHNDDSYKEQWVTDINLYQLLAAYGTEQDKKDETASNDEIPHPHPFMPFADAAKRLEMMVGKSADFVKIATLIAQRMDKPLKHILIPMFMAALEFVRAEKMVLSQDGMRQPLHISLLQS